MPANVISRAEAILVSQLGLEPEEAAWRLRLLANIQRRDRSEVAGNVVAGTVSTGIFTHTAFTRGRVARPIQPRLDGAY
jgi:hypothetical protein